jgi:hypothetical protein
MSHWLTLLQVWSGGATVGTGASCVHGALPQRLYGLSPQIRRQVRHVAASPLLDIYGKKCAEKYFLFKSLFSPLEIC